MKRLIPFFLIVFLFSSCNKEDDNIIWEKSMGPGNAFFIESAADSGIIACGQLSGAPYIVKFDIGKNKGPDYTSDRVGLFSSAWWDTSGFVAAGSSTGKMLLARIDRNGQKIWDTTLIAGFYLDITSLIDEGDGNFLAVGSASPDSAYNGDTGIMFVRFDTTGEIITKIETTADENGFVSASNASEDAGGNIYLPLTRKLGSLKPKASVAKYNRNIQKLWETDLYNNPNFTAGCYDAVPDASGNVFVTGRMEAANESGTLNNSYLASLTRLGEISWKKYIENSNSGSALQLNGTESVVMLNRNCFVIRKAFVNDGSDAGIVRMFSACDAYTTDAFGSDMSLSYDGNILAAGSVSGNFYLALKSSQ